MSSAHAQPSVEELLVSIRQAIHGDIVNNSSGSNNFRTNQLGNSSSDQKMRKPAVKNIVNGKNGTTVSGSMSQTRVSLQPINGQKTNNTRQQTENFFKLRNQLQEMGAHAPHGEVTTDKSSGSITANGFAGILSGDIRLEDALAKLKKAGLGNDVSIDETVEIRDTTYSAENEFDEFLEENFDDDGIFENGHNSVENDFVQGENNFVTEPETSTYADPVPVETFEAVSRLHLAEQQVQPQSAPHQPDVSHRAPHLQYAPQAQPAQNHSQESSSVQLEQALAPLHSAQAAPRIPEIDQSQPLTSEQAAFETSAAFNRLADTIVGQATGGERSIEELTRELLRPMLQSWLDENLPRLVERLVREEIERVARWGGK